MVDSSTSSSMSGIGNSSGGSTGLNNTNSPFFDPFTSMSSFGFFNPKDPSGAATSNNQSSNNSSSLLLGNAGIGNSSGGILNSGNASANALSTLLGGLVQQQQFRNHQPTVQHHVGHGVSKSPTYQSTSPPFGGPSSPSFFGSSNNSMNNTNNQHSPFPSSNYGNSKFPITTFSIEDTFQNQGSRMNNGAGMSNNTIGMGSSNNVGSGGGMGLGTNNPIGNVGLGTGGLGNLGMGNNDIGGFNSTHTSSVRSTIGLGGGSGLGGLSNNDISMSLNLSSAPSSSAFFNLDDMNSSSWNGSSNQFGGNNTAGPIGSMTNNSSTFNNIVGHFQSGNVSNSLSPPAFNNSNSFNAFGNNSNAIFNNHQSHPRMGSNSSPPNFVNNGPGLHQNAIGTNTRDMNHRGERDREISLTRESNQNVFGRSNDFSTNSNNTFGGTGNTFGSSSSNNTFSANTNSSSQHNNESNNAANQGVRETGIIEKLLHSYGFIQCCERQARLFFHFSQFEGTIEHLKLGDPVEFEMTYDRRTGKPIASSVTKIGPEVVLSEERVTGTVTTELHHESSGELQGRISYENRGECFFLPYCREDIEGNVTLCTGDTVSFQIATNHRSGNLTARYVRLENPAQPVRYKGIVSSIKDNFGFIERADVPKEIFFHFSETRVNEGIVVADNVEFNIQTRSGKEVASTITKLPLGTVIFEDIGTEVLKGQVLKPVDRTQPDPATVGPTPRSETMQGRLRYRGPDRQELEVAYGEKDQKGSFTMRHGDWVEFQLAIDRRDKQQRATNIALLEESFNVSGERREEGVISAIKDDCGFINCAERDIKMFFRVSEILDFNRPPKIADDIEFTIVPDPTSPIRQAAIRIKYLQQGAVQFEFPLSKGVAGVVVREPSTPWVSQEALAGILPSLATLGLPQNVTERLIQGLSSAEVLHQLNNSTSRDQAGEPGIISYQLNGWQQDTILFHWKDCKNLRNIRAGSKVTFDINQVRRNREIIAANIRAADDLDSDFGSNKSEEESTNIVPVPRQGTPVSSQTSTSDIRRQSASPEGSREKRNHQAGSFSSDESSPLDDDRSDIQSRSSPDIDDLVNGSHVKYNRNRSGSDSSSSDAYASGSGSARRTPRFVMRGHIAALKDGFGFIETIAQDGEIFFHSTCLVGDFSSLEVGQEVEYVVSNRGSISGKNAADMVKPLPKGSITRPEIFPEVLQGTVARPLRGANPDQPEYTGLIDSADGHAYLFGITSMLNKKEILQAGEAVDFQLDAQGKAVNIRAIRKKLRSAVEAVKGQYGFLSYELEDGKKLFFHMSEVKDHQHLNPGDEVEFVILQNPRNGKSSACSVVKLGESQRPERLLNRLSKMSVDESAPRLIIVRQPHGPDGSRGFNVSRNRRIPGILN